MAKKKKSRAPQKRISKICRNPRCSRQGKPFDAFRRTGFFCSDACRSAFHRNKQEATFRIQALVAGTARCSMCGSTEGKFFVWKHPDAQDDPTRAIIVCGKHHTRLSMSKPAERRRRRWLSKHGHDPDTVFE